MKDVRVDTIKPGMTSVYAHSLPKTRCVIARLSARKWHLSIEEWINAGWQMQRTVDTYPSKAVALVHAGAWLEDRRTNHNP